MKLKHLLFWLGIPLCCFGKRDFTMVDLKNGLTTELLAVGPTSITISVEWPLDVRPYGDIACFGLMGKTNIEERGWHYLQLMGADQTKGKIIREVLYEDTGWHYLGKSANFEGKAWFAVRVPAPANAIVSVGFRGLYEEDDEIDDEEFERDQREALEEWERETRDLSAPSPELREAYERLKAGESVQADEVIPEIETVSPPSRINLWLYVGIVLGVSAAVYFVRRKLKTRN